MRCKVFLLRILKILNEYTSVAAAAAKSLQSCPTLCNPRDGRLPCPWDSPGKNTGVGCHFRLQCMKVKSESEVAQSYPTPSDPMDSGGQRGSLPQTRRGLTLLSQLCRDPAVGVRNGEEA